MVTGGGKQIWKLALAGASLALSIGTAGAADMQLPPLSMPDMTGLHPKLHEHRGRPAHEAFTAAHVLNLSQAGATIPLWQGSVLDRTSGGTFRYIMVGQNPQTHLSNPSVAITVPIIPVVFTFPSGAVFDPTAANSCSPAGSASALTLGSPVFSNIQASSPSGTPIGVGQYSDIFQRANFFQFTGPAGANPNYSLVLKPVLQPALSIRVNSGGIVEGAPCGSLGLIDMASWDAYVKSVIFPQLRATLTPTSFPLFLFGNVAMYDGNPSNCCILGYHSAFSNPNWGRAFQTYGVADFDTSAAFSGAADVSTLSHEIAEWIDDPTVGNLTPAWGHIGQVAGCQNNLEVGDPLSGTIAPVTMGNNVTYHVQDLAFFSWFYHQNPSIGVDGLYSLFGTFRSAALPCR